MSLRRTATAALIAAASFSARATENRQGADSPGEAVYSFVGTRLYKAIRVRSGAATSVEVSVTGPRREGARSGSLGSWDLAKLEGAAVFSEAQDITELTWNRDALEFTVIAPARRYHCAVKGLAALEPRVECRTMAGAAGKAIAETVRKALTYLKAAEPAVEWDPRTAVAGYDLTWDRKSDVAVLGRAGSAVVVGVAGSPKHWILSLEAQTLCGRPEEARLGLEDPRFPLEEIGCGGTGVGGAACDEFRRLQPLLEEAAARGGKGITVKVPDCDTVHLYFDGEAFKYWTH